MSKIDSWMVFSIICAFMVAVLCTYPEALGDQNAFLDGFVNHEFLSFMGVIVSITLASAANIHIELRKKEKEAGEEFFRKTKTAVRLSAYSLICALCLSVLLVIAKPLLPEHGSWRAIANIGAIAIILWGILVILDITKLAFKM